MSRLVAVLVGLGWLLVGRVDAGPARPNVLIIIADDMGWGDLRCHGNEKIDTPVLDRLARTSVRFQRFYVNPLCAPTRASLLTGRYHLRTGVHGVTRTYETMRADEVTLAELFRAAGYATGCFGKWHNGAHFPHHPCGQGFSEFIGFCGGHWNNYHDVLLENCGRPYPTRGFITDALTDAAVDFITRNRDRPFFCYVPFNAPHAPWQAPADLFRKYRERGLDDITACVHAMVENIDSNVARLLARLEELKLSENTIVLFLTDNGPQTDRFNGRMRGRKGSPHEGGVRVPCFLRWTGRIPPRDIHPICSHLDLVPTLTELCRIDRLKTLPLDGRSLVPFLEGKQSDWPDDRQIFTHLGPELQHGGAVRTARWRAVSFKGKAWELYDMQADPEQKQNVAAQHPGVVQRLAEAFRASHSDVTRAGFHPIPTEIGHAGWPVVLLPGHEAFLQKDGSQGGIDYFGKNGWAHDWIARWGSRDAWPWWEMDVVQAGKYELVLHYGCAAADAGCKLRVEMGGRRLDVTINQPHEPRSLPSRDLVKRSEVVEKEWGRLRLGILDLPRGRTKLVLRAVHLSGRQMCDVKAVELRRVTEGVHWFPGLVPQNWSFPCTRLPGSI